MKEERKNNNRERRSRDNGENDANNLINETENHINEDEAKEKNSNQTHLTQEKEAPKDETQEIEKEKVKESHIKKYKIGIIDNYPLGFSTDRIARFETILQNMIADISVETIHYSQLNPDQLQDFTGLILSGSSYNVSEFYFNPRLKKRFKPEIDLILNQEEIPILGVCFGHQLIAYAYGIQICRMGRGRGDCIIFIRLNRVDEIINKKNIAVNVNHRDFISPNNCNLLKNFKILATSRTWEYHIVQYMKHRKKPLYSVQFHPETHHAYFFHPNLFDEKIVSKTRMQGENIIENFVWSCIYRKNSKIQN
ncbi:MAG: type 1 glutamine amidotransferase [Promethearchaeota archaeon]